MCVEGNVSGRECEWRGMCVEGNVSGGECEWRGISAPAGVCLQGHTYIPAADTMVKHSAACVGGGADCDFGDVPEGMDIVVTHMPCLLPSRSGGVDVAAPQLVAALHRTGG